MFGVSGESEEVGVSGESEEVGAIADGVSRYMCLPG